jgi:hypothetical protein
MLGDLTTEYCHVVRLAANHRPRGGKAKKKIEKLKN